MTPLGPPGRSRAKVLPLAFTPWARAAPCLLVTFGISLSASCVGSRTELRFGRLRYPTSLSGQLEPTDGRDSLRRVGQLDRSARAFSVLWTNVQVDEGIDLATPLNEAVELRDGDGVINLRIESTSCTANHFYPLSWLPFWPTCVHVRVTGDVVRRSIPHRPSEGASENSHIAAHGSVRSPGILLPPPSP